MVIEQSVSAKSGGSQLLALARQLKEVGDIIIPQPVSCDRQLVYRPRVPFDRATSLAAKVDLASWFNFYRIATL